VFDLLHAVTQGIRDPADRGDVSPPQPGEDTTPDRALLPMDAMKRELTGTVRITRGDSADAES
jgi:hypothetical protein